MARVLVTRAAEDALGLAHALIERGHTPVQVPLLKRVWEVDAVRRAAIDHPEVDWLVITSGTTAEVIAAAAPTAWRSAKIAAVGPATARRLVAMGRTPDLVPSRQTGAALVNELHGIRRKKILYPKADLAPRETALALEQRGAEVIEVVAYRNVAPPGHQELLREALPVSATLLLSGSAAERLRRAVEPEDIDRLGRIVVIGPSTAAVAHQIGLPVHAVAEPYTLEGLLRALG